MDKLNTLINSALNNVLIQEGINNKDYPLYHYCGFNKLDYILSTNSIESRDWDNDECICFTRDKRYIVDNTSPKYIRITIDPQKLRLGKYLYLKPFAYRKGEREEAEERICSHNQQRFTLQNANEFITQIDVLATVPKNDYQVKKYTNIIQKSRLFYNKIFFITSDKDFKMGNNRYALNINEFSQYLSSQIYNRPIENNQDEEQLNNIFHYIDLTYPEDNHYLNRKLANEKYAKERQALVDFMNQLSSKELQELNEYCRKLRDVFHEDNKAIFRALVQVKSAYFYFGQDWDGIKSLNPLLFSTDDFTPYRTLSDEYTIVQATDKWTRLKNIINHEGKLQLPFWCNEIVILPDTPYIRLNVNEVQNLFDINNGQIISPNQWYTRISCYEHCGAFKVKNENKQYNFITLDGTLISKVWFDYADNFEETEQGVYAVCEKGLEDYLLFYNGDIYDSKMNKVEL